MFLFGGRSTPKPVVAQQAPAYGALNVQTSCYGGVITVGCGTTRLTGNMIWQGDFQSIAHTSGGGGGGGGGGGKGGGGGGGGGSPTTTTYTYTVSHAMGISQGPVAGIGVIWKAKETSNLSALGGALFEGSKDQQPWGYLTSGHADQAIGYSGLAYCGFASFDLGESNSMPNLGFETILPGPPANHKTSTGSVSYAGALSFDLGDGLFDVETTALVEGLIAEVQATANAIWDTHFSWAINYVLTAPYGARFPATYLGGWSEFSRYCIAHGYVMSVGMQETRPANEILDEWVRSTISEFVWSGDKLKIVPHGLAVVTGNGITCTPDPTPVYDLGPDDFLVDDEDGGGEGDDLGGVVSPIRVRRKNLADVYNRVRVEFKDRANSYNVAIAVAEDAAHIDAFGEREAPVMKCHWIVDAEVAQQAAEMALYRHLNVTVEYEFTLGWRHARLEPMDLVTLTEPENIVGRMAGELVRLSEIEEDDEGRLTCKADNVPDGVSVPPARVAFQRSASFAVDLNIDPGAVLGYAIFEPPAVMTGGGLEIWLAACGGPNWGGCEVWLSGDGNTYAMAGAATGGSRIGRLTANLGQGFDPDTVNTLSLELLNSAGQLLSGTQAEADALDTLCYVNGEMVAYQNAALTGDGRYDLTYLRRGAHGTEIKAHETGASFVRLDGTLLKAPYTADQIGRTVWVKLCSFNVFRGHVQGLEEVQAIAYTVTGAPLASPLGNVIGLTASYQGGLLTLGWDAVTDPVRSVDYEIRIGPTFATASMVARTPLTSFVPVGNGAYWIAAHFQVPGAQHVYSKVAAPIVVTGSMLVANVLRQVDEAAGGWTGSFVASAVSGENVIAAGQGNILGIADVLVLTDVLTYGGFAAQCSYRIPASHIVDAGRVASCAVLVTAVVRGQKVSDNILSEPNVLALDDITGVLLGPKVWCEPQVRTAGDDGILGDWANYLPGAYLARHYDFQVLFGSIDNAVLPVLTDFGFEVDVPDRRDSFTALAVPVEGLTVSYLDGLQGNPQASFNGGPNGTPDDPGVPNVQITVIGAQAGDQLVLSAQSRDGFAAQIVNGGVGVARSINATSQGW